MADLSSSNVDPLFLSFRESLAGRYALQRELGRGGMAVVYLAHDAKLDRLVAIKLLPPELSAHDTLRDRFLREARTAARLSHPHVVPIHAVDEVGGYVFYVMSYVDGDTLAARVANRGPLPPGEASRLLQEVAGALAAAHAQGVVHRDVKPANILLERATGRAIVTDFGIARVFGGGGTGVGELLGTPEYMSPEQAAGEAVDARSDLYSLGVVAYYMISGRLPFTAPTFQAVLAKQLTQAPPSIASVAPGIPSSLAEVVDKCLIKDPDRRFQSAEALAAALAPAPRGRHEVQAREFVSRRKMWTLLRGLIDGWCERRALEPLAALLPAYLAFDGATDEWHDLWRAVNNIRGMPPDLITDGERAAVAEVRTLIYQAFKAIGRASELTEPAV